MNRLITLITFVALITFIACDDDRTPHSPAPSEEAAPQPEEGSDAIRDACYHFEIEGHLEDSATCLSHSTDKGDDGGLTVKLAGTDTTIVLEMPRKLGIEQYSIAANVSHHVASATVLPDGADPPTYAAREGTLTMMRVDDDAISALFDFEATSDTDEGGTLSVRGHLRDLELFQY